MASKGLYVTYPTSYEALVGRAKLKAGEWILVTAAAGGVGLAAVQIAKALGARVIGACSPGPKAEVVKRLGGADAVVDYTREGWQKEVLKLTGGKGVDVVYDPVGRIRECLKCVAWSGRVLVVGFAGGEIEKIPTNLVLLKNVALLGVHWGSYLQRPAEKDRAYVRQVWTDLLQMFADRRLSPAVYSQTYTLENLVQGLADLEQRKTWGKAIVRVRADPGARQQAKL